MNLEENKSNRRRIVFVLDHLSKRCVEFGAEGLLDLRSRQTSAILSRGQGKEQLKKGQGSPRDSSYTQPKQEKKKTGSANINARRCKNKIYIAFRKLNEKKFDVENLDSFAFQKLGLN